MKLVLLLLALATLCASAGAADQDTCAWDMTKMVTFQANDALVAYYQQRGNDIMCAMRSTDKGAGLQKRDTRTPPSAVSIWIHSLKNQWGNNMQTFRWFKADALPGAADFGRQGWDAALTSFGDGRISNWRFARYLHYDPNDPTPISMQFYKGRRTPGKVQVPCTGAKYNIAVNRAMGAVLVQPGTPPKVAARRNWGRSDIAGWELPDLRAYSDFIWAAWQAPNQDKGGSNLWPKRIDYCGFQQVSDCGTMKLIAKFLLAKGVYDLEPWPAVNSIWSSDTPEGRALLASIPGQTCAALLYEHKHALGIRHITKVTVFRGPDFTIPGVLGKQYLPQLVFHMAKVPDALIKADPPDEWVQPPAPQKPGLTNPPPSVPGPDPSPQPVIPGPSTPRPTPINTSPDEEVDIWRRDIDPMVSHEVKHQQNGDSFLRAHVYRIV